MQISNALADMQALVSAGFTTFDLADIYGTRLVTLFLSTGNYITNHTL